MSNKANFVWILKHRHYPYTTSQLVNKSEEELSKLIILTENDNKLIQEQEAKRINYTSANLSLENIKLKCKKLGLSCTGSKLVLIDNIIDNLTLNKDNLTLNENNLILTEDNLTLDLTLDEDQQIVIDRFNEPCLFIMAGPGSGKTTTLCSIITKANINLKKNDKKPNILVLAFNVNAAEELSCRIKKLNLQIQQKKNIKNCKGYASKENSGIYILTFDSFGYWASSTTLVSTSFRTGLESACVNIEEIIPDGILWDWLIIDEAQDLNDTHGKLINILTLKSKRLIVAGDPRQELYQGCNWYSNKWLVAPKENKLILRYNHRSHPQIVEILNQFSKINFPLLHYDQIATQSNTEDKRVNLHYIASTDLADIGLEVGKLLAINSTDSYENGNAYGISPISIKKFNQQLIATAIKQSINNCNPNLFVNVIDSSEKIGVKDISLLPNIYTVGTAKALKGTERSRVVFYGIEVPYLNYGISSENLKKCFYVSLSRAKNYLDIIYNKNMSKILNQTSYPLYFLPFKINKSTYKKDDKIAEFKNIICVTDLSTQLSEFCKIEEFETNNLCCNETPIDAMHKDHDFLGIYIESLIAELLNFNFDTYTIESKIQVSNITTTQNNDKWVEVERYERKIYADNGKLIYLCPKKMAINLLEILQNCSIENKQNSYFHTVARYSMDIGEPWTLSDYLKDKQEEIKNQVMPFVEYLKPKELNYQQYISKEITLHRSNKTCGIIHGITDFSDNNNCIEIKYTNELNNNHRIQSSIYASLLNIPHTELINVKSAVIEVIPAMESKKLNDLSRGINLMKYVAQQRNRININLLQKQPKDFISTCCISVDIETCKFFSSSKNNIFISEIGAIAFSVDGTIYDTFHLIADGIEEINKLEKINELEINELEMNKLEINELEEMNEINELEEMNEINNISQDIEKMTGLKIINNASVLKCQSILVTKFHDWVKKISGRRCFLHWGGDEKKYLKLSELGESFNGLSLFRSYAKRNNLLKLLNAKEQLLGVYPFEPHRAFEDALITAGIFLTHTNFNGIC